MLLVYDASTLDLEYEMIDPFDCEHDFVECEPPCHCRCTTCENENDEVDGID